MNITVSAYNRPDYLARTLAALSRCSGIAKCRVMVLCDPCDETDEQVKLAEKFGFECARYESRVGCNLAIRNAFACGFYHMGSEFHVHFEDDTVPCRDALLWFEWANHTFERDARVMNVSGYQRASNGNLEQAGLRRWFTPWGWGTWKDRWLGLDAGWAGQGPDPSWDVVVNHVLRAGRFEVFPTVSRIQNIGAELGTHVPSAEWHAANHFVAETSDCLGCRVACAWTVVREDDHADHA